MNSMALADTILFAHVIYVAIAVCSVPLIIMGGLYKWEWVHNIWFRSIHLLMITIVTAESIFSINCPLTLWERAFRADVNQESGDSPDFIASWLDKILFWHFPHWIFTSLYVCFGLLVMSLFYFVPVKSSKTPSITHR